MYILGISGHHHDASAALLRDGRIVAAFEEEKLSRVKRVGMSQCGGLPYEAIGYCLDAGGIGIEDIDYITYYLKPRRLLNRQLEFSVTHLQNDSSGTDDFRAASINEYHDRLKSLHLLRRLLSKSSKAVAVDLQLSHAASSFFLSGFDRAAILILNGKSDYISIATGIGEGRKIRLCNRVEFPHSLGWVYSQVTEYLGFRANGGEHNTQWLSINGEPEFFAGFKELIRINSKGIPSVDVSFFSPAMRGPDPFSEKFYSVFGDRLRRRDQRFNGGMKSPSWAELTEGLTGRQKAVLPSSSYQRNLAHSLQKRLEEVVLILAESVRREYRVDSLCLAGGVAFNSLLVSKLESESGFKNIFVPPAAGNSGCSIGSALFQWHTQLNRGRPELLEHVFLGPEYSDKLVKPVIDNCKLVYRYLNSEDKLLNEVAELLSQGNIVAWVQGRAEFGPRSLGARSILASPLLEHIKENLNVFVKHRETSRPFAASIPEEKAQDYFEKCGPLSGFLLTASRVRDDKRHLIPAAWFSDGMARVHTVSCKTNPLFWRLLNKFGEKTGVPILVNTSFNLFGEPIVCTPREAVRGYYCSGIDALAINRFLLRK